jgi:hypothetical protein
VPTIPIETGQVAELFKWVQIPAHDHILTGGNAMDYAAMYELIEILKRDAKWQKWPEKKANALKDIEESIFRLESLDK